MTCKDCYHFDVCVLKNEKVNFANNVKDLQADRFKCFKDKSKIIELPCKVGDTVYFIKSAFTYLKEPKAEIVKTIITAEYDTIYKTQNRAFNIAVIGETVFLTREEAEQALKECENK